MALCPKDNQLAVLATLSERKQVAGAGIHTSDRPSDLSKGASTKSPVHYRLIERRKGKEQKHYEGTTSIPQLRAAYQLPPLPH